jgi:predicted CopG family antitoxin
MHTDWIKPNSKRQTIWIAEYLKKKLKNRQISYRAINHKSNAELVKDIMEDKVITKEQRKKMASAWRSHVSRATKKAKVKALAKSQKNGQITITISKESYEVALKQKRPSLSVSTYIESLILNQSNSTLPDLLKEI